MTTTVDKTIASSGGDYPTPQLWEDAKPANLVTADQVWRGLLANELFSGAGNQLTIAGSTTDATRRAILTCDTGCSFNDNANKRTNALRYDASNGAAISGSSGYTTTVLLNENYSEIDGVQVEASSGTGSSCSLGGVGAVARRSIFEHNQTDGFTYANNNTAAYNCLIVQRGSGVGNIAKFGAVSGLVAVNCTFVQPTGLTAVTAALGGNFGTATLTNCAIFANGAPFSGGSTTYTCTTCKADTSSNPTGVTTATYDTSLFVATANASRDFRAPSGSALIDAGTTDSTNAPDDITKTTRSGTWDVGCWEYSSGGTPATANGDTVTATASVYGSGVAVGNLPLRRYYPSAQRRPGLPWQALIMREQREGLLAGYASIATRLFGWDEPTDATATGDTVTATTDYVAGTAVGGGGGTPATANGDTVAATASATGGAATGAGAASGAVVGGTASALPGSATGAASGAGATVAATASSPTVGSATGAASAAGALVTGAGSIPTAGSATGAASAAGGLVTATASSISGSATAGGAGTAAGATVTATASTLPGTATGAALATGDTASATASAIPGSATGGGAATANGDTVTATSSFIAGSASGGAPGTATGALVTATTSPQPGSASGAASANGATLTATSSFIAGAATAGGAGTATGITLTAAASFIAGAVTAAAQAQGVIVVATAAALGGGAAIGVPYGDPRYHVDGEGSWSVKARVTDQGV